MTTDRQLKAFAVNSTFLKWNSVYWSDQFNQSIQSTLNFWIIVPLYILNIFLLLLLLVVVVVIDFTQVFPFRFYQLFEKFECIWYF